MRQPSIYDQFMGFVRTFMDTYPPAEVSGEYYGEPHIVVYHQSVKTLPEKGRVEVNLTTPEATAFSWTAEITINDKTSGQYIHVLLQRDGAVVETYGKTILPVGTARAREIRALLDELVR